MPLVEELPGDVKTLKEMIVAMHDQMRQREDALNARIRGLENEIIRFRKELYGRKSEKIDPDDLRQSRLFNEAESGTADQPVLYSGHDDDREEVDLYTRKKREKSRFLPTSPARKSFMTSTRAKRSARAEAN